MIILGTNFEANSVQIISDIWHKLHHGTNTEKLVAWKLF